MLKVCLTGGIACGKSTVANLFQALGAPIIDMDRIAHEIVKPDTICLKKIVDHFGTEILNNGQLDRKKLSFIIFNDLIEKKWLENLLHPIIQALVQEEIKNLLEPYVIIVIPLFDEKKRFPYIDRVCVVDCEPEYQYSRLMQRDHLNKTMAEKIIKTQLSREKRLVLADDIIINNNDKSKLNSQVTILDKKYRGF